MMNIIIKIKYFLLIVIGLLIFLGVYYATLININGAVFINPAQIATGTPNQVLTTVGTTTAWANTQGGGGGTTTINSRSASEYTFNSTSGIEIVANATATPQVINFNLKIATTTNLAITDLAGQTGCLSVNATGRVTTSTCSGGTGLTSLNGQTGSNQTFSTSSAQNFFKITSAANDHQFSISEKLKAIHDGATTTGNVLVATGLPTGWASQTTSTLGLTPITRIINTNNPLSGGGDLTTDRTLSLLYTGNLKLTGSALDTTQNISTTSSVIFASSTITSSTISELRAYTSGTISALTSKGMFNALGGITIANGGGNLLIGNNQIDMNNGNIILDTTAAGNLAIGKSGGINAILNINSLTLQDKTFTFPDNDGTLVLGTGATNNVSYWSSANNLTSNSNFTFTPSNLHLSSPSSTFTSSTISEILKFNNATGTSVTSTNVTANTICLTADTCRTTWPSTAGFLTAANNLSDVNSSGTSRINLGVASSTINLTIASPSSTTDASIAKIRKPYAFTIKKLICNSDSGTATLAMDIRSDSIPNTEGTRILTSDLSCGTSIASTTTFDASTINKESFINVKVTSTSATAPSFTWVSIEIQY